MELRKTFHIRRGGHDAPTIVVRDSAGRVHVESASGGRFDDVRVLDGGRTVSVRHDGRMFLIDVLRIGPRQRMVLLNGHREQLEVLDELAAAASERESAHHGRAELVAEMPGLVVEVNAEPGQEVAAGQALVVLEAMKMQNELGAPRAGVVAEILVKPGQKVDGGTVLVRLADPDDPSGAATRAGVSAASVAAGAARGDSGKGAAGAAGSQA
jgi:biotin carboxyl carrier protein